MNQRITAVLFIVAVATAASTLTGCGLFRAARQESTGIAEAGEAKQASKAAPADPAESLALRIVRAGDGDAGLPDPGADLLGPRISDKVSASGDQLVFEDNIYLPTVENPKAIFLVWPESWKGTQIQSANIEHRIEDEHGTPIGAPERKSALFETGTRRWYLPFSAFFSDESAGSDPALQHILTFDLTMADGARKLIQARLRIIGAVPRLRADIKETASDFADVRRVGLEVAQGRLVNTAHRGLKLWLRADAPQVLNMQTFVTQNTFSQAPSVLSTTLSVLLPPVPNALSWHTSASQLRVSALHVTSKSGARSYLHTLNGVEWVGVELEPGEWVSWSWIATAVAGQTFCELPSTPMHHFNWWKIYLPCLGRPACQQTEGPPSEGSGDYAEPWWVGGYLVTGTWQSTWAVTQPWDGPPQDPHFETRNAHFGFGVQSSSADAYTCQGLF